MVHTDPSRRHDFVLLFDVTDGNTAVNSNEDNMPRVNPETKHGWVTDVCLQRKVRDYVHRIHGRDSYIERPDLLAQEQKIAYTWLTQSSTSGNNEALRGTQRGRNQVRGPVRLSFARSLDPIAPVDLASPRVAVTNSNDVTRSGAEGIETIAAQMERRAITPYGLYIARGACNPFFADETGASEEDLSLLWDALANLSDLGRSGAMTCRGFYIFTHSDRSVTRPLIRSLTAWRSHCVSHLLGVPKTMRWASTTANCPPA